MEPNSRFQFGMAILCLTQRAEVQGLIPSPVTPSADPRRAVASYWQMCMHLVLVNCLGGLSLPRKSVVRLTDRLDMTIAVYCGCKTKN